MYITIFVNIKGSQEEAPRREMEEDNSQEGVAKDLCLNEEFSIETDINCTTVNLTCNAKANRIDMEMFQMHEELSFENELKLLELVISNPDGNHLLLSTENIDTISSTDNLQSCSTETSVSLEKIAEFSQESEVSISQTDILQSCRTDTSVKLNTEEFSQNKVPKKNSLRKGDVMILKALSDKAWEDEKRRQECSKEVPNVMPNTSSSSVQNTASSRLQENQALWLNDIQEHFEVFPDYYSCKKCKFIITHNFNTEDRLHPRGSNCELCKKALFHYRGVNETEEEQLPICKLCGHLMKHLYKHEIEETGLHRLTCVYCHKPFGEPSLYLRHVKKHRKRLLKCSICSTYFSSRYVMADHIRLHIRDGSYFSRRPKVERVGSLYNLMSREY